MSHSDDDIMQPAKPLRILIAPHEIAGQMQILATTFRRLGHFATAVNYYQPPWLGYVNDVNLGFQSKHRYVSRFAKMLTFSAWAALNYDVFHFFYGRSLFYRNQLDLPILRLMGKKIFVHFRGLEIINRDYIVARGRRTAAAGAGRPAMQTQRQKRRVRTWQRNAHGIFVSTAELLACAPGALLVPQVIDLDAWPMTGTEPSAPTVRIVHAPTDREKKGTEHVIAAIDRLKAHGLPLELVLIERMSHQQVRTAYAACHLAIDQLLDGWYGNFSIEMMALGKPTICFIDPQLRQHRPTLPLVGATPETLPEVLERLVADRHRWAQLAAAGRAYVEEHHSARQVCTHLLALYERA